LSRSAGACLEVFTPEGTRQVVELEGRAVTPGRAADCDVAIEETFVSVLHAPIKPAGEGFVLKDAGSTNGTWVDGSRAKGVKPLTHGSTLVLGLE